MEEEDCECEVHLLSFSVFFAFCLIVAFFIWRQTVLFRSLQQAREEKIHLLTKRADCRCDDYCFMPSKKLQAVIANPRVAVKICEELERENHFCKLKLLEAVNMRAAVVEEVERLTVLLACSEAVCETVSEALEEAENRADLLVANVAHLKQDKRELERNLEYAQYKEYLHNSKKQELAKYLSEKEKIEEQHEKVTKNLHSKITELQGNLDLAKRDSQRLEKRLSKSEAKKKSLYQARKQVEEQMHKCSICLIDKLEIMILPCKHLCMCSDCSRKVREVCPICNGDIEDKINVYVS